jgi:hypothetical protein
MAESHVVSALVAKRAEIAGVIAQTERQLGQFRADLVHLDAASPVCSGIGAEDDPGEEDSASRSLVQARRIAAPRS